MMSELDIHKILEKLNLCGPSYSELELPLKSEVKLQKDIVKILKNLKASGPTKLKGLPADYFEVKRLSPSEVRSTIISFLSTLTSSIEDGECFEFEMQSRSFKAQIYVKELGRIVLKKHTVTRSFSYDLSVNNTTIMVFILKHVLDICKEDFYVTKRDLFYTNINLFKKESALDSGLDDVCCLLGCTRSSLHVEAEEKGVVVGRLTYWDNGDKIDCRKLGRGGKAIPPDVDRIEKMKSDALFILVVEKHATYMTLAVDKFYNRFPCIIVTGKGQPDVGTRLFLNKMKRELELPVLGLMDSDPYGLKILSVYSCGSQNMCYDSGNLTTPDIKWLGFRPTDVEKCKIPNYCRMTLKGSDIDMAKKLAKADFLKDKKGWCDELSIMIKSKERVEIQALNEFGIHYLTEVYLPHKLQERDWI